MKLWTYVSKHILIYKAWEACAIMFWCLSPHNNFSANMIKPGMNIMQLHAV